MAKTEWMKAANDPICIEREFDQIHASDAATNPWRGLTMEKIEPDFTYITPQQGETIEAIELVKITREMAPRLPMSFDGIRPFVDKALEKWEYILLPHQFLVDIGALPDLPVLTYERTILEA